MALDGKAPGFRVTSARAAPGLKGTSPIHFRAFESSSKLFFVDFAEISGPPHRLSGHWGG
jgi:hypothetical protein